MVGAADSVQMHGHQRGNIGGRESCVPDAFWVHHDIWTMIAGREAAARRHFDALWVAAPGKITRKRCKDFLAAARGAGGQGMAFRSLVGADEKVVRDAGVLSHN